TKVLRGLAELPEEPSDPELHEVRRRARAARFTAEIAVPVHGKPAGRIQKTARRMQQVLGEHQDTVIAQGVLRRLGSDTRRYGADPFTYGRLQALAEAEAQQARERFARLRSRAERPALRTWLED
ncbi:MAG: CHAD domain-containing protein, partial [Nocardioidaceae bacterium]|nr:CHAD domain-containing protein [Nocardioidaceae bacterium]